MQQFFKFECALPNGRRVTRWIRLDLVRWVEAYQIDDRFELVYHFGPGEEIKAEFRGEDGQKEAQSALDAYEDYLRHFQQQQQE